ncbi:MAG: serine--tRNA ligase, partial [Candidatus Omnitrophica bacterium]|nr:serine--tRNA ligase [Candidatus Omnitrophota bacterium]MBD3269014.1 serine--tRNA ligase [Candidatus Omnitrophota bacterium]
MLDVKFIRNNSQKLKESLKNRNYNFDLDEFLDLDARWRKVKGEVEDLNASQNRIDKDIKKIIKEKKDPSSKIGESKEIKSRIAALSEQFSSLDEKFKFYLARIPNIPHESLPVGGAENNKVIKEPKSFRDFNFKPRDHIFLAETLDVIDFKRATKLTGSNFVLFKGWGAKLQRALINFMLDLHTSSGKYKEIVPSKLVNRDSMFSTGQLPNLEEDMYRTSEDDLFLIPTAEVPITNIHRGEIIKEDKLPLYYTAYTPCFRREAGSYGKDTRGLLRVHEFDKIELVKFVKPEDSYRELEELLSDACSVLDLLKLPYRVVLLATGDISFAAAKCYDIELYAPGVDKWLEVSSCSNFEDFQARRGNIRYKEKSTGKNLPLHTLNGSG